MREKHKDEVEKIKKDLPFSSSQKLKRKLQKCSISLRDYDLKQLLEQVVLSEINGIYFLENHHYYSQELGIMLDDDSPEHYIY